MSIIIADHGAHGSCSICNCNDFKNELENIFMGSNHIIKKYYSIEKFDGCSLMKEVPCILLCGNDIPSEKNANTLKVSLYHCEDCIESALYIHYKEIYPPIDYSTYVINFMLIREHYPKDIANIIIIVMSTLIESSEKVNRIQTSLKGK